MATPKPGEIRCPTCHRSTPPAAFCTQCGSAIPQDARIRPRGMDRDELQDRIRARRSGGDPYRRGGMADEGGRAGYQRFEPEPEDSQARRARQADDRRHDQFDESTAPGIAAGAAAAETPSPDRRDLTRETDDWSERRAGPPPAAVPPLAAVEEPEYVDNFDDSAYEDEAGYPYEYDEWDDTHERRSSGAGAFAILGFLALGVLALLGGAVLAGVFGGDPGVGQLDPTATPIATVAPTVDGTPDETPEATDDASPDPAASPGDDDPVVFPDGFTAEAEPCIPGSPGANGCNSNGASNSGVVDVWVGFRNGNANDVIGATVLAPDGSPVGEGSIDLARIGCSQSCNGWTYFPFRNLGPGTYEVRITRNGDPAGSTSFEVS